MGSKNVPTSAVKAPKKSSTAKSASKSAATKKSTSKTAGAKTKKASSARELIAPNGDKRLIRRDAQGRIKESDDLGRSLAQDVRRSAKTKVKAGQGDRGDQSRK